MCSAKTGLIAPLGVVLDGLKPCSRCCVLANPTDQVLDKFSAVYILFNLVLVIKELILYDFLNVYSIFYTLIQKYSYQSRILFNAISIQNLQRIFDVISRTVFKIVLLLVLLSLLLWATCICIVISLIIIIIMSNFNIRNTSFYPCWRAKSV